MNQLEKILKEISKPNKDNIIDQIKNALRQKDPDAYSKWRDDGYNVNHLFYGQYTLLHLAAKNDSAELVEVLIKNGANVNAEDCYKDIPLHHAARLGEVEVMKILIKNGSSVNAVNELDSTPLHTGVLQAPRSLKPAVAKVLIENGAEVNTASAVREETPLHTAVFLHNTLDTVQILLKNGASVYALDYEKSTPLHTAAEKDSVEIVRALVQHGADLKATNKNGDTPLHIAVQNNRFEVVKYLVNMGANVHAKNIGHKVPLACATEKCVEIKKYLAEAMIKRPCNLDEVLQA